MSKRPFVRRGGTLIDDYEEPAGKKYSWEMPASMLGETLSVEERNEVLSRTRTARGSAYAMHSDRSPELLDALLAGLENLNMGNPMPLTMFLDDARVQPALVNATRRAPAGELANFAQVLGMIGGPGSRDVLRERLQELAVDGETFDDDPFFNAKAGSLATTACSLLALDPDADAAAAALLRLFEHPCAFNRRSAYRDAASLVRRARAGRTGPMRRLADAIAVASNTDDEQLFLFLCQVGHGPAALAHRDRLERLLCDASLDTRDSVVNVLVQPPLLSVWSLVCLRDRLPHEPSRRLRRTIAAHLGSLLTPDDLAALVEDALADESPSLRYRAVDVLEQLPGRVAAQIASRSVIDEPDAGIKRRLQESLAAIE